MTNMTTHFTLETAEFSSWAIRHGVDNTIPPELYHNILEAAKGMERVRTILGLHNTTLTIDSWYRCEEVNQGVGGAKGSAHKLGFAVDFLCPQYGSPKVIAQALIEDPTFKWDQIIMEGTWVHISFAPAMRGDKLVAHFLPTGVTYQAVKDFVL